MVWIGRRAVRGRAPTGVRRARGWPTVQAARRFAQDVRYARAAGRLSGRTEVRRRPARRRVLRDEVSGVYVGRRAHHLSRRVGIAARVEYAAGTRHAL